MTQSSTGKTYCYFKYGVFFWNFNNEKVRFVKLESWKGKERFVMLLRVSEEVFKISLCA